MIIETIVIGKIVIGKIVAHQTVAATHQPLAQTVAEWATPPTSLIYLAGKDWLSKSHLDPERKEALSNFLEGTHNLVHDWLEEQTPALDPGPGSA
jgi:hypothetical protein